MSFERLTDLQPDPANANLGTERGEALLDHSLRTYGAGRSILTDKHGVVLAGNKTHQKAVELGLGLREVHTAGDELVVVVRDDLDLATDPAARELAYADNRIGQVSLRWSPVQLAQDQAAGIPLAQWWHPNELAAALAEAEEPIDPAALWQGMPEFENESEAARSLHVHFRTEIDCQNFCDALGLTITEQTKTIWYPAPPDRTKYRIESDAA